RELIEILRRNLRPEIRHEILNIPVGSISRLREICRKRECFLEELKREQVYKKGPPFKSHVSELLGNTREEGEPEFFEEVDGAVEAISLVCWNCRKEGHRYQDCTGAGCDDTRPYAIVRVLDREVKGLMDTGAAMSCIGGRFAKEILGNGTPVRRVFTNVSTADGSKQNIVGRISRVIELYRFKARKKERQEVTRSVMSMTREGPKTHPRPYAMVKVAGRMMRGLLDSGASISLIGRGCRELVERLEIPWKPWHAKVRTANGSQQQILGKVKMQVEYKKRT
ncbi:hypothetical protein KR067_012856, partial [Drosophila pandora]